MKYTYGLLILLAISFASCKTGGKQSSDNKEVIKNSFVIKTKYGEMKGRLYDETPLHRDNFIKLVNEGFYDSLLFHRVIQNFMIQGGDPDSKNAAKGVQLGNGGPGYTVPAEFNPNLIHKKGALAAARLGDNVNPSKASSGSQFYIVQGVVYDSLRLSQMSNKINESRLNQAMQSYLSAPENLSDRQKLDSLKRSRNREALMAFWRQLTEKVKSENSDKQTGFSQLQKETYSTIGGTPHLDGAYTVFGEIYEGLNVIDSIALVKGDRANRPLEDIKFTIEMIK